MKSDPYPNLPVMAPTCDVAVGTAVGDGAEVAVAVTVGVGVDTAVVGGTCALVT
jgi:hypothetical protein